MVAEFVGVNSYGEESYIVVEKDGIEYETIGLSDYVYTMGEIVIVLYTDDVYHSYPFNLEKWLDEWI